MSNQELSFMDNVKLFFRGWIGSKQRSNYVLYNCSKHGVVECKIELSMSHSGTFSCPECDKE